jgi:hypothetical protein
MPVTDRNGNALELACVSAQVITPKSCRLSMLRRDFLGWP